MELEWFLQSIKNEDREENDSTDAVIDFITTIERNIMFIALRKDENLQKLCEKSEANIKNKIVYEKMHDVNLYTKFSEIEKSLAFFETLCFYLGVNVKTVLSLDERMIRRIRKEIIKGWNPLDFTIDDAHASVDGRKTYISIERSFFDGFPFGISIIKETLVEEGKLYDVQYTVYCTPQMDVGECETKEECDMAYKKLEDYGGLLNEFIFMCFRVDKYNMIEVKSDEIECMKFMDEYIDNHKEELQPWFDDPHYRENSLLRSIFNRVNEDKK